MLHINKQMNELQASYRERERAKNFGGLEYTTGTIETKVNVSSSNRHRLQNDCIWLV